MKVYLYISLVVLVLLVGCAQTPTTEEPAVTIPVESTEPAEEPVETAPEEIEEIQAEEQITKIPNDVKEILEKGKKLKSYFYNYKSPESDLAYGIYVKANKIRIDPPEIVNIGGGRFYNKIYLDTEQKTAEAYCKGYSDCGNNLGKITDLTYEDAYIETPIDWLEKVTEAELLDERQVEGRDAIYIKTNIGNTIVESYYGFLYNLEDNNKKWEFTDVSFNSVTDADVNPK